MLMVIKWLAVVFLSGVTRVHMFWRFTIFVCCRDTH